ncbi:MAG: transporter substrate-binding domain-containing protein [Desulfobacterium sp.]|nr:transporter substrate-binding domain-containing protein [Desulfobacterium sp.]
MKRILLFGALFILLLPSSRAGAETLIFNTQDFKPYSYEANGVVSGPAADIIRRVCENMDSACSFRLLPWPRATHEVRTGEAHAMFVIGWNRERSQSLNFSPPLFVAEYGFFVRKDNPLAFKEVNDIKGYTVCVYGPSNTSINLEMIKKEIKDLTIEMTPQDESAFKKLSGRQSIDAVYSNRDVGYKLIEQLALTNIRYSGCHLKVKYYIGFSKQFNDNAVVDRFNKTYLRLYKSGSIQELLKQYAMKPAPIEKQSLP